MSPAGGIEPPTGTQGVLWSACDVADVETAIEIVAGVTGPIAEELYDPVGGL